MAVDAKEADHSSRLEVLAAEAVTTLVKELTGRKGSIVDLLHVAERIGALAILIGAQNWHVLRDPARPPARSMAGSFARHVIDLINNAPVEMRAPGDPTWDAAPGDEADPRGRSSPGWLDQSAVLAAADKVAAHVMVRVQDGDGDATVGKLLERGLSATIGVNGLAGLAMVEVITALAVAHYAEARHSPTIRGGADRLPVDDGLVGQSTFNWANLKVPYHDHIISLAADDSAGACDFLERSSMRVFRVKPDGLGQEDVTCRFMTEAEEDGQVTGEILAKVIQLIALQAEADKATRQ